MSFLSRKASKPGLREAATHKGARLSVHSTVEAQRSLDSYDKVKAF
jgi:hypothetical protein